MKSSFIATFYNEGKTIKVFLNSLFSQTKLPDEIILVDGLSTDNTVEIIKKEIKKFTKKYPLNKVKILVKKGNRSVGRNEAIKHSNGDIILSSDAGCILDKNWVRNIQNPFTDKNVDVVAGYYKGKASNIFQKCLIPFVLVMPDRVNPNNFLPATRTMAFKKSIWGKAGGFDERYSHNEDYVFAHKLKKIKAKIIFQRSAIVEWIPRTNLKQTFTMFFRFAYGDAESKILRPKVILIFARYIFVIYFLFLTCLYKSGIGFLIFAGLIAAYVLWSIKKNYRYVRTPKALFFLPLIQFIADSAVLIGTTKALIKNVSIKNIYIFFKKNLFLDFVLLVYVLLLILTLQWGIPNQFHPFPYHMDEWHQLQAVRATVKFGTPNTSGAANGTMFHFLLSAVYLAPFTLLHVINPFVIKITDFVMRERIFELLRINTILYGVLSIITFYKIAKELKIHKKLAAFLFTFNPLWLILSGYFKYDIALIFWILLFLLSIIYYSKRPSVIKFVLLSVPLSIAIAVKISALPLLLIYVLSYLLFSKTRIKSLIFLILGIASGVFLTVLLGMPDTLFGKGNILNYLYDNILNTPQGSSNLKLGMSSYEYLYFHHYPLVFGHGLIVLFFISLIIFACSFICNNSISFYKKNRMEVFIFLSLIIFALSLIPLKINAGGNRSLVLLPFIIILSLYSIKKLWNSNFKKRWIYIFICFVVIAQIYESCVWIRMKTNASPQEASSAWITKKISNGTTIGIENIPIYQFVPDIIQKEFYYDQYKIPIRNKYFYKIIDSNTKDLPSVIVITNGEIESALLKKSLKIELLKRLKKENYIQIASFKPDLKYFNLLGDEKDFYLSGLLVAVPSEIVVFKKP